MRDDGSRYSRALLSSDVGPVSSFGTMMAIGSMIVPIAAAFVLPGGILLGQLSPDPGRAPSEHNLAHFLGQMIQWFYRHRMSVGGVSILLAIFTTVGMLRLKVETDFSRNFHKSSPIIRSLDFVEEHLGGAGTWEVNFPAPPLEAGDGSKVLGDTYLRKVRSLADRLRELENADGDRQLTKVVAVTDLMDLVPGSSDTPEQIQKKFESIGKRNPEFVPGLYNPGAQRMRIVLRALERQPSEEKVALIKNVEMMAAEEFGKAHSTGLFVLLAFLIEDLLRDQMVSFIWAAVSIGIMMLIAFRSWRIGLVCMVPNVLPLVILMGMLGWLGVPINIGTAMIAAVAIGLTVDASIHYVYEYNRAQKWHVGRRSTAPHAAGSGIGHRFFHAGIDDRLLGPLVVELQTPGLVWRTGECCHARRIAGQPDSLAPLNTLGRQTQTPRPHHGRKQSGRRHLNEAAFAWVPLLNRLRFNSASAGNCCATPNRALLSRGRLSSGTRRLAPLCPSAQSCRPSASAIRSRTTSTSSRCPPNGAHRTN